jgi:hypothetical protein
MAADRRRERPRCACPTDDELSPQHQPEPLQMFSRYEKPSPTELVVYRTKSEQLALTIFITRAFINVDDGSMALGDWA